MESLSEQTVKGYQRQECLGEGAYGAVYRAFQPQVGREVAIKIILPEYANRPEFIRRFEREAQLVAQLEHMNIVPLYDYWRDPDGAFLVMRLMKGGSLADSLSQYGPWEPLEAVRLVDQVAAALDAAHQQGVVHRDLKPANILLDEDGNAYLSDFGIAKELGADSGVTQTGAIVGTPAYITPEQVQSQAVTPQTDIYAFGVVLYELLTCEHPFAEAPVGALIVKHLSQPLPLVRQKRPELPVGLDQVIQKATAKVPAARYPNALTMASEFRRALQLEVTLPAVPESEIYNPYKGLRAFQEADAADFFGREALTAQLLERLSPSPQAGEGWGEGENRFLAIVGPSGSGKSSVVKAGLLPALRKGSLPGSEHWFITEMVPSAYPLEELELALLRIAIKQPPSLLEQLEKDERGLLRAARRVLPQDGELLLIVDQLEEVFTLIGDPRMSAFFLQSLYEAVIDPRSPVRVVVTLRADFYDRPLMHPDFSTLMKKRTEVVVPLTSEELERAIRAPAERAGVVFEKGLVASIIADVVDQPGTLPLLQYALTELFERREGRLLTQRAYHSIEGVLGALGRRAEEVYRGLNEDEKESARQLFLRLVTLGEGNEDTRRRALNSELESLFSDRQSKISNIINTFGQARLLTFDRDPVTRGATVEVAHEALLHKWRRLDEWLDQSRADLRMQRVLANATAEWLEAKQDSSFLLRGTRLAQFEAWIATTSLALTQAEGDYLDASLVERRAHLEAETQRRQRELEQISIGLAGQALNELHGTKPERAVLLALEALEDYPYTWQAHRALGEAVMNHRLEMVLSHEDVIYSIEMSKDGTRLLTASKDGTVRMWDAATGEELLVLSKGAPLIALWSPDECSILTIGSDWHSIQLWDISTSLNTSATASDLRFIQEVDSKINIKLFNWFPWSPKGDRFVTAHDDGARIWNAADGTVQFILSGHEDTVTNAAWSPTGDHIVTTSRDLSAILWEANTGRALSKFPFTGKGLNFGEWSPSGDCFILQVFDRASIYETVTGAEVLMLSLPGLMIRFARFSPDGNQLITTTIQDGNARLWDAETGQLLSVLTGLTQGSGISWSPSGEYATVVGTDGSIRIWDTVTGLELQRFPFLGPDFGIALWSPSEDHIYAAGDSSNEVKVFKLSAALSSIPGLRGITYDASWSPDGREFSRSNPDGTVVIRDAETRAEVMTLESGTNYACTTRWSPSGDRFLTTNGDGTTRIWDASSGELLLEFIGHESYVFSGEWSPDGSRIVTTEPNKDTMILWDATTGEQIWKLNLPGVMKAVWSPDGTRLAVTSSSGHGSITDAASGEVLLSFFEDYPAWVEGPAWSSDGNKVVMFSGGNGWIFDTSTGEQLVELSSGFISSVWVVYWSPGDDLIFTLGGDGTYRVFEAATGVELLVYDLGGNWPSGALSPDGTRMLITTDDGKTSLYPTWLTIEQLITYAKEHCVFRQLTTAERQLFGLPDREEKDTPS